MKTVIKTSSPNGWLNHQSKFSSPFSLLNEVMKEEFFPSISKDPAGMDFAAHMPAVNISEVADKYIIELSAPGFTKENFKIEILEGNLVVSAERKEETKSENKKYSRREFSYGTFKKSFTLAEDSQEDKILAGYENGILNITIPKKEEAKPQVAREIKIG